MLLHLHTAPQFTFANPRYLITSERDMCHCPVADVGPNLAIIRQRLLYSNWCVPELAYTTVQYSIRHAVCDNL